MSTKIPHIYIDQLPEDIQLSMKLDGFTVYKGIIVVWDEDKDTRVLSLIDSMPLSQLENLILVYETEGTLTTIWAKGVPDRFKKGNIVVEGDNWMQSYLSYVLHIKR
jgi:hypothetical protein